MIVILRRAFSPTEDLCIATVPRNEFPAPSVFPDDRRLKTEDMMKAALKLIGLYQRYVSPMLMPACRYTPTCSHYAAEAIEHHGARGVLLAAWRLLRCHPFARGGFDPVPLPKTDLPNAQRLEPKAYS